MLKFSFRLCLLVFLFIPRVLSAWYEDLSGNLQTFYKQFTTEELPYKTHVFSEDPLIVYIENFITLEEASQLVQLRYLLSLLSSLSITQFTPLLQRTELQTLRPLVRRGQIKQRQKLPLFSDGIAWPRSPTRLSRHFAGSCVPLLPQHRAY